MPESAHAPRDPLLQTLAVVRIATGLLFILFGEYKVFGSGFITEGFTRYVERYMNQNQAVGFYQPFLAGIVLPHAEFFAWLVGLGELAIGLALVAGLWVRIASYAGALHMLNLTLATWHAPGTGAPLWRYFAAQLDHLPLLFLFALFIAARTGELWSLPVAGRRLEALWQHRKRPPPAEQPTGEP